jgi:hypothetical protein
MTSGTAAASGVALGTTGAMTTAAAATAAGWWYESHFTVRTVGTSGTLSHSMNYMQASATPPTASTVSSVAFVTSATVDTTLPQAYCIDAITNTSTSGIQLNQFMIAAWD